MKITQRTLLLLKKHSKIYGKNYEPSSNYNFRIALIAELLRRAEVIVGNSTEGYEPYDTDSHGITQVHSDYERKTVSGMITRYPSYIKASLTNGLNEVTIVNPDKLVASILDECETVHPAATDNLK